MCGRFAFYQPIRDIIKLYLVEDVIYQSVERYNIAPGAEVPAIVVEGGRRALRGLTWGLVPSWAKDPKIGYRMINARAETVHEKPSFRHALRAGRCLVMASGFYEWNRSATAKIPVYFRLKNGEPMAFAGLREHWESDGRVIESCTVITTSANRIMAPVHDRMPVIVAPDAAGRWLDPEVPADEARALLAPCPADIMECYPVSTLVNSPKNDAPELVRPI